MRHVVLRMAFAALLVEACGRREVNVSVSPTMTPSATPGPPAAARSELPVETLPRAPGVAVVVIDADPSAVALDGVRVAPAELTRRLAIRTATVRDTEARIVAGSNVPYARVIDAMDRVRAAGITRISLTAQ